MPDEWYKAHRIANNARPIADCVDPLYPVALVRRFFHVLHRRCDCSFVDKEAIESPAYGWADFLISSKMVDVRCALATATDQMTR